MPLFFFYLEFNSVMDRLADMTNANMESMIVHHDTWTSQIKDVMTLDTNYLSLDYYIFMLTNLRL